MVYCHKCGNTRVLLDGTPCDCSFNADTIYSDMVCIDIPEQYQGVTFNQALVPRDCGQGYVAYLQSLYEDITSLKLKNKNICLCSPTGHSKTILAYSCIQQLFRKNIPTCPLYDIMEIRRIMADYDMGKGQDTTPLTAQYLFVRIPQDTTFLTYATMSTLVDRRVRRGLSTIFLFNGSWSQLVAGDQRDILTNMLGDGSYTTLENRTWRRSTE